MDYLFFGINSLAAGISALILFQQARPHNHLPLKLAHYLGALFLIATYYSLNLVLFSRNFWSYLLANSLPILLLSGSLFMLLKTQTTTRS